MVGIAAGVTTQHVAGPISGWEEFGIVVLGTLASAALIGVGSFVWRWMHRPKLKIVVGNVKEFDRRMVKGLPLYQEFADGRVVLAAHAKFLRVEETSGNFAREVRAWITAVDPAPDDEPEGVKLRWWTGSHTGDIPGHRHDYLFLQHIVITDDGRSTTTPTNFAHQSPVTIEVTLYVGEKKHSVTRLEVQWAWPGLLLDMAMHRKDESEPITVPDPFHYPMVRKL